MECSNYIKRDLPYERPYRLLHSCMASKGRALTSGWTWLERPISKTNKNKCIGDVTYRFMYVCMYMGMIMEREHTTIALERSWWASSSLSAILAILWERSLWRVVQRAFFQIVFGISLKPKPSRKAPVTSPKVLEQAMAKPRTLWSLFLRGTDRVTHTNT